MKRARFAPQGALAMDAASWGCEFLGTQPQSDLFRKVGTLAIVDIKGPIVQHAHWMWDSYEAVRARVDSALASACTAVVLCIDSPGGEVAGCFELSEEIRSKAKAAGKRVVSYVDGQAASAAYAIACAGDAIYVPQTGMVGSIGCIKVAVDQTGLDRQMGLTFAVVASGSRKADGNPHVAITEATIGAIQNEVDGMAAVFFELVGRARGLAPAAVAGLEAAQFLGATAVAAKLADQVITFDGLLAMLASGGQQVTAHKGAEAGMDEKEKAIAALRALAESKDEKEAAGAKAALKAMGVDDGEKSGDDDKDKPKDEPKKDDAKSKSEGDDKPKDEPKKDDEDKGSDAKASLALAAKVQDLTAKWEAKAEAEERAELMATRPDFAPEVVDLMKRSPLGVVRDAVKTLPRGSTKTAKGQVGAAIAAINTKAGIQGEGQGEAGDQLPEADARELDVRMGLAPRTSAIRHEGTRMFLGVMTPAEARAELARKGATK